MTPASGSTPPPASRPTAARPAPESDDEAWAAVRSRWDEEEAHRAFLDRFADLDGLAEAGRRYREVLKERPGDATALGWRDEILRRATAQGLAQLPRASTPQAASRLFRRSMLVGTIGALALAAGWVAWRLLSMARG